VAAVAKVVAVVKAAAPAARARAMTDSASSRATEIRSVRATIRAAELFHP
jgi:hypothetical protein